MTKEDVYKSFLEDPLLVDKKYITPEKAENLKFIDPTEVKLLEIIKIAISGNLDGDSDGIISRKINQYLNL
jgi:hypothetical protein